MYADCNVFIYNKVYKRNVIYHCFSFDLMLCVPVTNLSVMPRRFLDWNNTMQIIKRLAQAHNKVPRARLEQAISLSKVYHPQSII